MDQRTHPRLLPSGVAWPLACTFVPAEALPAARRGQWAWRALAIAVPAAGQAAGDFNGRPVRSLQLQGIDPQALWSVRVDSAGHTIFELPPLRDARGNWLTAGLLLRDMARLFGTDALEVDLGGLQPPLHRLRADLLLVSDLPLPPPLRVLATL